MDHPQHIHIHFDPGEISLMALNADLQTQVNRAVNYIEQLQTANAALTKQVSDLTAQLAAAPNAEDEVDASAIGSQLDAAGVPAIPAIPAATPAQPAAPAAPATTAPAEAAAPAEPAAPAQPAAPAAPAVSVGPSSPAAATQVPPAS